MKKDKFIVVGTKGGTGKSTISSMVLPVLCENVESVTVYGIDDNNSLNIESNFVTFKSLKTDDAENMIDDIEFKSIMNSEEISIVDAGGGTDTLIVLDVIKKSKIHNMTFIIPLNDDIDQVKNLKDTINAIKTVSKNSKIIVILNKVMNMSKIGIEEQFVGIYGNERYGINSLDSEILNKINEFYFLENSPLFSIIKNEYNTTLLDSYVEAKKLLENLEEKKAEWAKSGREYFIKQNAKVRLANDVIALIKRVYKMKSMME